MAESGQSLFNRGMISGRQAAKFGVLGAQKGTRINPAFQAGEEHGNRGGARDQGRNRDRGDTTVASVGHINKARQQREGSAIASRPTRGGRVNRGGQPTVDAINQDQRPAFPAGATVRRGATNAAPRAVRGGRQRPSGPMYGGPNGRP
jgi:hypothetical protein